VPPGTGQSGTEPPGTGQSGTEPPGTGQSETEPEVTILTGTDPEDFPIMVINELIHLITDKKDRYSDSQYMEFLIKPNHAHDNFMLEIYGLKKEPFTWDLRLNYENAVNNLSLFNHSPEVIKKTCIVAVMEGDKYIDAVCLIDKESSVWPAGYEHFPAIMQKLYDDNVWRSSSGGVAGPGDCVVTSSITSSEMSINRREGTTIYHTADDWYIADKTIKKPNTSPPPKTPN
jgi:hypothetical protein